MARFEPAFLALFLVSWLTALLDHLDAIQLAGSFGLGLYPYFIAAATFGWLAGNVFVHRARWLPRELRWRFLVAYFVGPPGVLLLLRALAAPTSPVRAPLVPALGFGVFTVFFLVPVTFGRIRRPPPPTIDGGSPGSAG